MPARCKSLCVFSTKFVFLRQNSTRHKEVLLWIDWAVGVKVAHACIILIRLGDVHSQIYHFPLLFDKLREQEVVNHFLDNYRFRI